jgi:hypothetical protein
LCFGTALAQEPQDVAPTALESQPVTEGGQSTSEDGAADQGQKSEPAPEKLSPSLDKIEAAIRDLIAQERAAQGQGPKDEEIRDLEAQEGMAFWAIFMFWATVAAVVLTFAGIILIRRTLKYTKIAAGHTEKMLAEARKTTEAGISAANEARRQADIAELSIRNLERPYLFPEIVKPDRERDAGNYKAFLRYRFKNHGRTPAVLQSVSVRLESAPELPLRLPLVVNTDVYEVVSPGASTAERRVYVDDTCLYEPWNGVEATKMVFHGSIGYGDMAGTQHTDYFCLRTNENAKGFVMEGGETYNRRTSVGPSMEIERPEE